MTVNMQEIGQRLRTLRTSYSLTQVRLTEELGISLEHEKKIETGKRTPSIDLCMEICDYFEVSLDHLLAGRPQKPISTKEVIQKAISELQDLEAQCD